MASADVIEPSDETDVVVVRYWASARAAAGVESETVPVNGPVTLAALVKELVTRHPSIGPVLHVCSVLRGDEQVRNRDPETVVIEPGTTVEFLPPFAGG